MECENVSLYLQTSIPKSSTRVIMCLYVSLYLHIIPMSSTLLFTISCNLGSYDTLLISYHIITWNASAQSQYLLLLFFPGFLTK